MTKVYFDTHAHQTTLRKIGNGLFLCKPVRHLRVGWAEASKVIADAGDDTLVWPEFANSEDAKLVW